MAKNDKPDPNVTIQPDTIPVPGEAGNQAIELLDKHRNTVMLVAVVAVLAICGTLVVRELNRQKLSEASQAFSEAAGERSIEKLDTVVADFAGSIPAGNALLTKAEIQLDREKYEDAKVTLLTFVDKYSKHPRHAQGLYALGNLSHVTGDYDTARDYYDRALADDPSGDIGPLILIREGDIALAQAEDLRKAGKKDEAEAKVQEARQSYEESITRPEFRSNPFIDMAEDRLALADVGDVPVVPAPPEPKPEPAPEKPAAAPAPATPPKAKVDGAAPATKPAAGTGKPQPKPTATPGEKKATPPATPAKPAAPKPADSTPPPPKPKPAADTPAPNDSKPDTKKAPAPAPAPAETPKPAPDKPAAAPGSN
ncbi:MAG: tetratricopeptide repeat protein [Verrucomicrobiae bacterium]|nr:tetratricopeptide repeat protein [Verrucomicrobiae bacterium]